MGSRHPRSLGGPTSPSSPPAQGASTSSGSNNSLGFTRPRQVGQPENVFIQPGIPPQFSNASTTISQMGPGINVDATRSRYRSLIPEQSSSTVGILDKSIYAGMSAEEMRNRISKLKQEKEKRDEDFIKSAEIEREAKEKDRREKISAAKTGITGEAHPSFGRIPSKITRQKMSVAKLGENNPLYGVTGQNHPNFGKTPSKSTRNKMSENAGMLGITGANHPASKAYWINQLPEELRETAEQKRWGREKLILTVNSHKYEASQTTTDPTSSTSSAQEAPLEIPRQPIHESSTDQSPPKQDKSDDPDKPDLDF
jgi:hypothetical protein